MGAFLSYSIISGLLLLAMYLVFRLLLAAEKQPAYNRGLILAMYAIAFLALPVMHLVQSLMARPVAAMPDTSVVAVVTNAAAKIDTPVWGTILIWIYLAGVALVLLRTIVVWIRIVGIVAAGEHIRCNGYTLVLTSNDRIAPFSWMRYVVMSRNDYEQCGEAILAHELHHIGLYHWADLLIAQVVVVINWFNPAAWLTREELMLIHEYQADMAVLSAGHDAKEYQMLLIKKAVGARFPSLANSLNHSKLKKRITMMYQEKSGKGRRLKALALVPAAVLALVATSVPQVQAAFTTLSSSNTTIGKVKDISSTFQENGDKIITVVKEFHGSRFTGDWVNPCSGKGDEQMATIKAHFTKADGGYDVVAYMYDKNGRPIKTGYKFCKGEPKPSFEAYSLENMEAEVPIVNVPDKKNPATADGPQFKVHFLGNDMGNETTVILEGSNLGNSVSITDCKFISAGKAYDAKAMQCEMLNGNVVITAKFPFLTYFEDVKMDMNLNGQPVTVDFDSFMRDR